MALHSVLFAELNPQEGLRSAIVGRLREVYGGKRANVARNAEIYALHCLQCSDDSETLGATGAESTGGRFELKHGEMACFKWKRRLPVTRYCSAPMDPGPGSASSPCRRHRLKNQQHQREHRRIFSVPGENSVFGPDFVASIPGRTVHGHRIATSAR